MRKVKIGNVIIGPGEPLALIVGPCVIEGESLLYQVAEAVLEIREELQIPVVFKASYDKVDRTSLRSFRGPGLLMGLEMLQKVKSKYGLPILSDVHRESEVEAAAKVLDVIQIPPFLCKQTDLLLEAGETGKPLNVKKSQFMSPWEMRYVVEKIASTGNSKILLTEQGTTFGYNDIVVDFRSLSIMASLGYPVAFDATHAARLQDAVSGDSSSELEFVESLARAAIAAGCHALYIDVHPNPEKALYDGPNMIPLERLPDMLKGLLRLREVLSP